MQFEVLCENHYFYVFFIKKLKHIPTIVAKDLRVDMDWRKVHIKNIPIKTTPSH